VTLRIASTLALAFALACGGGESEEPMADESTGDEMMADDGMDDGMEEAEAGDIVDVAVGAGSFETLVAAVQAAGLVETLKGPGPFTVFAPTDDAFAALPAGTVEELLEPENRDQLVAILTYHVVSGDVSSSQVVTMDSATTLQGSAVTIDASDGVMINDATVIQADIAASNGTIHVIDTVLMPPAE
jgi:uncharacterized surface protein with fasciclin (FAS1) repeats